MSRQWEGLISGDVGLPPSVVALLRSGAVEESLAAGPRTHLEEDVASTVSMARHQRQALAYYTQALGIVGDDHPALKTRLHRKAAVLSLSLEGLEGMNRRIGSN